MSHFFLFGQQFATALTWMCLMGVEKGTERIGATRFHPSQARRECALTILESLFFFPGSGAEARTPWGFCCPWAAGPLTTRPLCSLPGMCRGQGRSCRAGSKRVVASCRPSSPSVAVRRRPCPTRSQQITGQRGARAVFRGCPAFGGHMACSPQMGKLSKY